MTRIQDLENYFDVNIVPMDHEGNPIGGECRMCYIHKKYFPRIAKFFDDLQVEICMEDYGKDRQEKKK